jgi:methylglutaconyl-CoA hydratase
MRHTATLPEEDNRLDALDVAHMFKALHDIPALTVALVEGSAIGAGAGLVAACDMAIATADAQFAYPEVRLGMSAAVLSPYVIEAIGARAARRLFATGATFDAAEALRLGLITELAADGDALNAVQDRLATDILACAPGAIGEAKRLVRDQAGREIDRSLIEDSARRYARACVAPEAQEGLDAFLNRRKPNWAV